LESTGNWIVDILNYTLAFWSDALRTIWDLLTTAPQNFRGGAVWRVISGIQGGLKGIAYALLVLFFLVGVVRTTTNFAEIKRPEVALKLFIRFAVAKAVVTYSMDLMNAIYKIVAGILSNIGSHASSILTEGARVPDVIQQKIQECSFLDSIPLWIVSLIGALLITVLSFVMILTVYSRFFKLFMYTAVAPIPLSSFAGEGTSQVGRQFLKSYAGVCLQGAVIIISCIVYSVLADTPAVNASGDATTMVWSWLLQTIFFFLVLVGAVKMSDRVVKEMIGF
jgi:hypothetical protein